MTAAPRLYRVELVRGRGAAEQVCGTFGPYAARADAQADARALRAPGCRARVVAVGGVGRAGQKPGEGSEGQTGGVAYLDALVTVVEPTGRLMLWQGPVYHDNDDPDVYTSPLPPRLGGGLFTWPRALHEVQVRVVDAKGKPGKVVMHFKGADRLSGRGRTNGKKGRNVRRNAGPAAAVLTQIALQLAQTMARSKAAAFLAATPVERVAMLRRAARLNLPLRLALRDDDRAAALAEMLASALSDGTLDTALQTATVASASRAR